MAKIILVIIVILILLIASFIQKKRIQKLKESFTNSDKTNMLSAKYLQKMKKFGKIKFAIYYGFLLNGLIPSSLLIILKYLYNKYLDYEIINLKEYIGFYLILLVLLSIYGIKNAIVLWTTANKTTESE